MRTLWDASDTGETDRAMNRKHQLPSTVRILVLVGLQIHMAQADIFTVTTTRAYGTGSLSAAIQRAEKTVSPSRIVFNIPLADEGYSARSGGWTILLTEPLPVLARGHLEIDAATQPKPPDKDSDGACISLVAARPGVEQALCAVSSDNTIRGFAIGGFKYGIVLYGSGAARNAIVGNRIGLSAGDKPAPNDTGVIVVEGACDNRIEHNVVSGNAQLGVYLGGRDTARNRLVGNRIGCDPTGTRRLPNGVGVMLTHARNNVIGGAGVEDGNLISGNDDVGLLLVGKQTEGNTVLGNFIGVDRSGTQPVHNNIGIVIKSLANRNTIGGPGHGERNVVSGNIEIGIYMEAVDGNRVVGNLIGTDVTGKRTVQEGEIVQGNGVEFNTVAKGNVVGGTAPGERNIISGHKVYGVVYYGHCERNATIGNYIGTDISGEIALPNATGICVDCASHHNAISGNVISGNVSYGIFFVTRGTEYNTLRGNRIGTNTGGTAALPNDIGMVVSTGASRNRIGGSGPTDGNLISGNRQAGVMITNRFTEENVFEGNSIGIGADGITPLPNRHGVIFSTYPKRNRVQGNLIAYNKDAGVVLCEYAEANIVVSNRLFGTSLPVAQDRTSSSNTVAHNRVSGGAP